MPAPKGHPLWGNPLNHKKLTPEELWTGACEYFDWCNENPWRKQDFIKGGDSAGQIVELKTVRPYSISGLCIYLNISMDTFENYAKKDGYETYFGICSHIKHIIDTQHFEGGMVGTFNANIVTRKLGLAEKTDITSDGKPLQRTVIKWGDKELEI
jgi:hypothetical protein